MRARIQGPYVPQLLRIERKAGWLDHLAPGRARHAIGRDPAQQVGNRLWIAEGAEEALHPRSGKGGEEVLQVHTQNDTPAYVGSGKSLDGPSLHKAMHCGMRRNAVEDGGQNPALQIFQTRLRHLNQPNAAGSFGQHAVVIVFEATLWTLVAERLEVSKP